MGSSHISNATPSSTLLMVCVCRLLKAVGSASSKGEGLRRLKKYGTSQTSREEKLYHLEPHQDRIPPHFAVVETEGRRPATNSDVPDVDNRPCSIDKNGIYTSLTHRRHPGQGTLFSLNTVTDAADIFSRLKCKHRQNTRRALLILK